MGTPKKEIQQPPGTIKFPTQKGKIKITPSGKTAL
jgi:hypothetical protein